MSKKHFQALAEMVVALGPRGFSKSARQMIAEDLADVCARFNNNFDRGRFMAACGF